MVGKRKNSKLTIEDVEAYLEKNRKKFPEIMEKNREREHESMSKMDPYHTIGASLSGSVFVRPITSMYEYLRKLHQSPEHKEWMDEQRKREAKTEVEASSYFINT
jgi:hypothetical protein